MPRAPRRHRPPRERLRRCAARHHRWRRRACCADRCIPWIVQLGGERMCTSDANRRSYLVAIDRSVPALTTIHWKRLSRLLLVHDRSDRSITASDNHAIDREPRARVRPEPSARESRRRPGVSGVSIRCARHGETECVGDDARVGDEIVLGRVREICGRFASQ